MTHTLTQLSPHVHLFSPDARTDRPGLGLVSGTRASLLVDAGNSPAHALTALTTFAAANLRSPQYVVITHHHWDHIFGASALHTAARTVVIAHSDTAQRMAAMAALDWGDTALDTRVANGTELPFCRDMIKAEMPERRGLRIIHADWTFSHSMAIDLGGVVVQIRHTASDHAADSVLVSVLQDQIVFAGDSLYPSIYLEPRRYTDQIFAVMDQIRAFDPRLIVQSHDDAPTSRAEFDALEATLRGLRERLLERGRAVFTEISPGDQELAELVFNGL